MEKTIPRTIVGNVLEVGGEFGCKLVRERIFIMTKGHSLAIGVQKMRIVHGHLGEVSVRRTSERMWKDEMQSDTRGGHHAPDSGRQTGERQARVTKVLEEVKWRISILREVGGLSGAKSLEQGVYHGGGKMWFGAAEEADGLMRKLVNQSFLEFFTAGTGFGLLLIPSEAL